MSRFIRSLQLARIPVLTLVLLGAFGPIAYWTVLGTTLLGTLDLDGSEWGLFWVSFGVFMVEAMAVGSFNLIHLYGPDRFRDFAGSPRQLSDLARTRGKVLIAATVPALVLLGFVWTMTTALSPFWKIIMMTAGLVVAAVFCILILLVRVTISDSQMTTFGSVSLVIPLDLSRDTWLARFIKRTVEKPPHRWIQYLKDRVSGLAQFLLRTLEPVGDGYFVQPGAKPLHLRQGHSQALTLSLLGGCVYLFISLMKRIDISREGSGGVIGFFASLPALVYLLFTLALACLFLSALTFFLDYSRFPLLTGFIAIACVTSTLAPSSDHFFFMKADPAGRYRAPSPRDVLKQHPRAIVIAAEGGGIQAAAWTAEVIARLEEEIPGFKEHIAVISGVSGGAVGALHIGARFNNPREGAEIVRSSSISEVAWGWTNPDLQRAVLPWFGNRHVDRGWALERTWERNLGITNIGIAKWADEAAKGALPAFIFNTTQVETGKPVVISTTNFPANEREDIASFRQLYGEGFDMHIATAARLSSTFPYASPAARPDILPVSYGDRHFVDGGYYDNFGLYSLVAWLEDAAPSEVRKTSLPVFVLVIRSFPEQPNAVVSKAGWFEQALSPIKTMLRTRDASQLGEAHTLLRLFADNNSSFCVSAAVMTFEAGKDCSKPPLSWHLRESDKQCLTQPGKAVWSSTQQPKVECIKRFLNGDPQDSSVCWEVQ